MVHIRVDTDHILFENITPSDVSFKNFNSQRQFFAFALELTLTHTFLSHATPRPVHGMNMHYFGRMPETVTVECQCKPSSDRSEGAG